MPKGRFVVSLLLIVALSAALLPQAFASPPLQKLPIRPEGVQNEEILGRPLPERIAQQPPPPEAKKAPEPIHPAKPQPPAISPEEALRKIHPRLRDLAQKASPPLPDRVGTLAGASPEPILIEVIAEEGTNLSAYFVGGKVIARPPLSKGGKKTQIFIGFAYPYTLMKIASLAQVEAIIPIVLERTAEPDPYPPDQPRELPKKGPEDWAKLRANAAKLREGWPSWDQAKAFGDGRPDIRPADWFEVMPEGPHQAKDAWKRGYTGKGVTVAVLDDGIDPAHPDLLGTQKIYSSTVRPQYNGWPYVFSPLSMLLYAIDSVFGTTYIADGFPGVHYVDTSATPTLYPCGVGISCFKYTPLIDYGVPGFEHTYVISNTMTKSGVVHVGTHPDNDLRDFLWGEKVAVLVTDPNVAGVYDTVYVDLDDDYDFRDEKPLTRADVNDPSTYNNMIAYRDVNGDGKADISGGMVYFIADGSTPIPGSDWIYGPYAPPPANGALVAFSGSTFDRSYSHGTQCASNIVGQGRTNAMLPTFSDLPGDGKPAGAVFGMAPDAKVVNISDIYWNFDSSVIDAYIFAAVGYDACDQTGYNLLTGGSCTDSDAIQITTNSYGESDVDNDGWDYKSQVVSQVQRWWAPHLQFLFSTGNGAPAYGTVAPPTPDTAIGVGASTEFGSTGWDSITSTTQIMFNDVIPFSNRGPGARGTNGVDVVAGGAFAAGDEELNYYSISTWGVVDGNRSWVSWGGTSRSAPVAGGVLALIYQAYKEANGDWPTYDVAKALLKASATDLNYDTFTQGAGSVNADRGTAVAGGHYGIYAMPDEWNPGDYRGNDWPGFAHIVYPGNTYTRTITVYNPGAVDVTADVEASELILIGAEEFDFTVTPAMVAAESAYGRANRDNFFKAFNYFIPITATAGMDPSWYKVTIPAGTDLMIVRQIYPYSQFDVNGDYSWDNRFYLTVYNWKDVNGDGNVWEDKDRNGVVNFINDPTTFGQQADGAIELKWDDPRTELDRWEFGRFGYNRPGGNTYEVWVHDPLERMHDGIFIGLRHLYRGPAATITTTLHYRIEFYQKQDVPWLKVSTNSVNVPAGSQATFVVTATVPTNMPPGMYEAGIYIHDPGATVGSEEYEANTTVIPVVLNVAAPFTDGMQFGGVASAQYDANRLYNNGVVRGFFDWTWRAESGDWRFFYSDVADGSYPAGTKFLVKDEWASAAPHTDIDTIVLGPTPTSLGSGRYDWEEPDYFGPYVLDTVARSPNTYMGSGIWRFNTSSGANEDWVAGPIQDGLHAFLQHNVLFEADQFDVVFTKTVGTLAEDIHSFNINTYVDAGLVGTTTLTATLDLNGLQAEGFLIAPETTTWVNEPLDFTGAGTIEWTYVFNVSSAYYLEIWTSSADIADLDLYLYRRVGTAWQQVASSAGPTASEHIYLGNPPDGLYLIAIDNYSGPAGHFNMTLDIGKNVGGITVTGTTTNPVPANTPVSLGIWYNYPMEPGKCYDGLVLAGPPEAPQVKQIPLHICRQPESAGLEKSVNYETAFPGMELQYTIKLYNFSDPAAYFEFTDPIPAGTDFVTVTGDVITPIHDAPNNQVVYTGTLPLGAILDSYLVDDTSTTATAEWVEISETGTPIEFPHDCDDDYFYPINLSFNFPFFGDLFNAVAVATNGTIYFEDAYLGFGNTPIPGPNSYGVYTFLAPFWDDLVVCSPGAVYYQEGGTAPNRYLVVQYNNIRRFGGTVPLTFEVIMYEDGTIKFLYKDVGTGYDAGGSATVGLQESTTNGVQYSYNAAVLADDLAILFTPTILRIPSAVVTLTVRITDTVAAGSWITNTASLVAVHTLPQETQAEPAVTASARTHIGAEDFATSYKVAPAQVTAGDVFTYEIHVINSGDKLAYVTLSDTLPVGVTYVDHWSSPPSPYFTYDPVGNKVEWSGNIGPGDEWVFYVKVKAGTAPDLWDTVIQNIATISWDDRVMPIVSAGTRIVPPYRVYLPLTLRNYAGP